MWARVARIGLLPLAVAVVFGILGGVGAFTFGYGKGWAYLTNDPAACANCHVMQEHFDTWQASSHKHVAACNDCHLPHGNLAAKMYVKSDNGFFHSLAFTTGEYHDPIQIKRRNRKVTQGACMACHQDIVHQMVVEGDDEAAPSCIHCHSDVGHAHKARSGRGNDRFIE